MNGWHNLKRLRPRREWKAAGSIRVGGNEARELQIGAPRSRFLSQKVNLRPTKWGRGGCSRLGRRVVTMDSLSENYCAKGNLFDPLKRLLSGSAKPADMWPAGPCPST